MAAISVRDIPDIAWDAFKAASQAEGLTAEGRIRQWIIREAHNWTAQNDQEQTIARARWLRRHDGELLHGSLTFKMVVVGRDWEAVKILAPLQQTDQGTSALDADDWEYIRREAAKDKATIE